MGENKFRKPFTPEGIGNNIDVPKTYRNFRDMGGLSCDGGYRIKEHIIYRTEAMHARTQEEKTFIENLGLDVMIDFRCPEEAKEKPDYIPKGCTYVFSPVYDESKYKYIIVSKAARLRAVTLRGSNEGLIRKNKLGSYGEMPFSQAYRMIFEAMDGGKRFAFHCTEGKDRTGIGAALVEYVLGRTEEEIRNQYLLSNKLRPAKDRSWLKYIGVSENLRAEMAFCEPVQPLFMEIAKKAVLDRYSDMDEYLRNEFDVTEDRVRHWREIYLEKE